MDKKIFVVLVATALILGLGISTGFSREKESDLETKGIIQKLDEILDNQAQIIEQFEQITKELEIIKIRASR